MQREYEQRQSQNQESDQAKTAKGQLCSDIVRDISILQQVQLGVRELTNAHREHIEQAVNSQLKDISDTRLNDSDKEMIANNVYKVVNSKEWREELDVKQEQLAHSIRVKYTAKTIDEFLSSNNAKAISDLANIRSIGMDESGIFAAFKEDHNKGEQGLKELSDKVTIATGFAADNKAAIDEAKRFGYSADNSETARSLVGMNKQEARSTCMETRDKYLGAHLDNNISRFDAAKYQPYIKMDEIKSVMAEEHEFLRKMHLATSSSLEQYPLQIRFKLEDAKTTYEQPELLEKSFTLIDKLESEFNVDTRTILFEVGTIIDAEKILSSLEKCYEHNICYSACASIKEERLEAKSLDSLFTAIEKEQSHLASLHGNIEYHTDDKQLMSAVEKAHNQSKTDVLDNLKNISYKALSSGAKSEGELVEKLKLSSDFKQAHEDIDKHIENHDINTTLASFDVDKKSATTIADIFKVIAKEQEYLSNLHGNIKYPEYNSEESEKANLAHSQKRDNSNIDRLKETAKASLSSGAKSEKELMTELSKVTDLKAAHKKLDKDIEAHTINKQLSQFKKDRNSHTSLTSVIDVMRKEQEYLSGLHSKLRHNDHDSQLMQSINSAHNQTKDNSFDNLNKAIQVIGRADFSDKDTVFNIVKNSSDPVDAHKNLVTTYHDYYMNKVHKALNHIEKSGRIKFDNQEFHCPLKLVQHISDTHNHEYAPHKEMQQLHNKIQEHHKAVEMQKGFELSM